MRQVFIERSADCADDAGLRAQALRHPQARHNRDPRRREWTPSGMRQPVVPDADLQGHADAGAGRRSISPTCTTRTWRRALALVHSRFSTNTFPSWERSHPYRYIAHNGEINTLRGNINWMHARAVAARERAVRRRHQEDPARSSTRTAPTRRCSTTCLELLVLAGRSLPHAMMMMIPEPWADHETMSDEKKAFYEYHSCLMEPWDGPASIAFTDGT